MKAVIDWSQDHSRTVLATLALILVAGSVAYIEIPRESFPDVDIPIIYVSITHDGISPEDAERLLIRPMEQELRAVEGTKEMRSTGFEGGAFILLEFEAGFDADQALTDVREKVDVAKKDLPEDTKDPSVHEVSMGLFPVLVVVLSGDVPERALLRLARELQDIIEGVSSVLKADIAGEREDLVEVIIDPVKVESYGMSVQAAAASVRRSNLLVAAGAQDTGLGRFSVKVPGLFATVRDVIEMPLKVDGDAVVRVGDIAEVRRSFKDPNEFAFYNGRRALVLEVTKRVGENIIDTIDKVRQVVEEERDRWPENLRQAVHVSFAQDQSNDIRQMVADLQNNVITAVLLVVIVVVGVMGVRSAGLIAVSIPGSFLLGMLVLSAMGLSLNMVVLYSLILAVGMLVDGTIVVTEYADRKMIEGETRKVAYRLAATRMAGPIIASTLTTLAAFLPLMFWPGIVGEIMKFLPITLTATLAASLFMALIFVPTLGTYVDRAGSADRVTMRAGGDEGDLSQLRGLTGAYVSLLRFALRGPAKVLLLATLLLIAVPWYYAMNGQGVEFFPDAEPDYAKLQVRARGNLSIHEKSALMREVESLIIGTSGIENVYTRAGGGQRGSEEAEDIIGTVTLEFTDWKQRRKATEILAGIEVRTGELAGIIVDIRKQEQGPPVGKPIQLQVSSRRSELLGPTIATIREGFDEISGLTKIEDSRPLPGIDWEITVNRAQAAKFGADVSLIGGAIRMATTGIKLGEYRPDDSDDEIDIRARYPREYRTLEQLDQIRVPTAFGPVPISNFVERQPTPKVGTVKRVDGRRVMTARADVEEGILPDNKVREIQAWLTTVDIDPGVDIVFRGEDEEQRQARDFLTKAFGIAMFLMAIILVTQFNSFYSAFLILTAVIMSTTGVLIGLLVIDQPFGIVMSGVGVIALAGVVVNNNIVLIDTFDRLKKNASSQYDAILRTGAQRMRPVLLTTITTVLALLPMVFGANIDLITREVTIGAPSTQWWIQLSTAMVFGLGFASILTLVVTPCGLMIKANVRDWLLRRRQAGVEAVSAAGAD